MEHAARVEMEPLHVPRTIKMVPGPTRLKISGCLTLVSYSTITKTLDGAVFRACPELVIDLRPADHVEIEGLAALELYVGLCQLGGELSNVTIVSPTLPRRCSHERL